LTNHKFHKDGAARRQVILNSRLKYLVAMMDISSGRLVGFQRTCRWPFLVAGWVMDVTP